jgi:hypothetical protein
VAGLHNLFFFLPGQNEARGRGWSAGPPMPCGLHARGHAARPWSSGRVASGGCLGTGDEEGRGGGGFLIEAARMKAQRSFEQGGPRRWDSDCRPVGGSRAELCQ